MTYAQANDGSLFICNGLSPAVPSKQMYLVHPNGDRYIGEVCGNDASGFIAHGNGIYIDNYKVYSDGFHMSLPHGNGILRVRDNNGEVTSFNGEWSNGQCVRLGESKV